MLSPWARATGSGLLWSGLALVGSRLVTFVSVLVLARLLTPSAFGVVAAITAYLALIELISDVGMKAVVVYEQEEGLTSRLGTAFTLNLVVATLLSAGGVAASPLIADFFAVGEYDELFMLGSINPLLAAFGNIHDSLLVRELDFRRRMLPELVRGVSRGGVGIVLAAVGFGAASLVWGLLAGTLAWLVVLWRLVPLRPRLSFDLEVARSMFAYGSAAATHSLLSQIGVFTEAVAISRLLGERALGLYTVAMRVPEMLVRSVAWNVSAVLFPALSRRRATGDGDVGSTTLELIRLQSLYVLPMTTIIGTLNVGLMVVLFGGAWADAGGVLVPLAILAAVDTALGPIGDGLRAVGRQSVLVWMNLVRLPVFMAIVIVAAREGIEAVAWTLAGTETVFAAGLAVAGVRVLGMRYREIARSLRPGAVAALGAGAAVLGVRWGWPADVAAAVAVAAIAGALGAAVAVRVLAAATWDELVWLVRSALPSRQGAT